MATDPKRLGGWHRSPHASVANRDVVRRCGALIGREFDDPTRSFDERLGQGSTYMILSGRVSSTARRSTPATRTTRSCTGKVPDSFDDPRWFNIKMMQANPLIAPEAIPPQPRGTA